MSPVALASLESWSAPFWPTLALIFAGILYLRGWRRLFRLRATRFPRWRAAAFLAGIATLWVSIASPLDAFAGLLLSAHMVQHLLLMAVAPPLLLLGNPAPALLRGLPRTVAREALGPFLTWPALRRLGHRLTHPAVGLSAMALAMWGWHVRGPYELALGSPGWHEIEHATFMGAALIFWWPVVLPWPSRPHWAPWTTPLYLLAGDLQNTLLAAILTFSDRVLYPTYENVPRLFGLSAMADQALAGAIMWVPGSLAFLAPAAFVTASLLAPRSLRRSRVTASPPRPRRGPFDLLRAPGVGRLLRWRHGRRALQGAALAAAGLVVLDGVFGPPAGAANLAGVLPWTYGRGLLVIGLLAAGNLFCMTCPFMLPREIGKRLGLATRGWPARLRSKWLAAGLLGLFFWAYEAFGLWDRPSATAWVLVGYFVAAFAVDAFFRGASFCKYVCPIGQFQFVGSLVSPLEVRVRRPEACLTCRTHDCIRGNALHRGCELELFLPRKSGSMDCTFCLDCVKACPHDNIGILPVLPGRELAEDRPRSSLGSFAGRPDVAVLALVFVAAAFVNALAMVRPQTALPWTVAVALAFAVAAALSPGESRPRLAMTLVPLGLSMWAAHFLFHLVSGWAAAWPILQRALALPARWAPAGPLVSPETLLGIELLALDAGLLLTFYTAWRAARAARGFLPWAALAAGLWALGVWTYLQPMPMRGMAH